LGIETTGPLFVTDKKPFSNCDFICVCRDLHQSFRKQCRISNFIKSTGNFSFSQKNLTIYITKKKKRRQK